MCEPVINKMPLNEIFKLFVEENSLLYWKDKKGNRGRKAGSMVKGYLRLEHMHKTYAVHNILWCIYNNRELPEGFLVDHFDGDPLNNSKGNLRVATISQNNYNTKLYNNNKSGVKGVSFDKETGKWLVQIRVDGINKKIGRFASLDEAADRITRYRDEVHKEFSNHG